jgi:hypothetical protein
VDRAGAGRRRGDAPSARPPTSAWVPTPSSTARERPRRSAVPRR